MRDWKDQIYNYFEEDQGGYRGYVVYFNLNSWSQRQHVVKFFACETSVLSHNDFTFHDIFKQTNSKDDGIV